MIDRLLQSVRLLLATGTVVPTVQVSRYAHVSSYGGTVHNKTGEKRDRSVSLTVTDGTGRPQPSLAR